MLGDIALLLVGAVLVNNFVLVQFLGLCPFMGVSNKLETAMGMSVATTFVLTLASVCSYLTYNYLLVPLDLAYLRTISFILVIAVVVQFTEMVVRKTSPLLHRVLGVFLPLITTNCAVLGVALLNINQAHNFIESLFYGLGAALGQFQQDHADSDEGANHGRGQDNHEQRLPAKPCAEHREQLEIAMPHAFLTGYQLEQDKHAP